MSRGDITVIRSTGQQPRRYHALFTIHDPHVLWCDRVLSGFEKSTDFLWLENGQKFHETRPHNNVF